ncbi:hypothetical protein Desor_4216 [Desulfosporosinus orientis DSM 765]|uniref:Uncharacterized protein n=1 Tax=Desulfosporosinus orientis (strain ATCC 19365 / DSM 765 / NCIMB 8382 / VKM B-1628 / Singapore I) TaxID=768706 RepID=G7WHU0_DESOD|nr:hypothetical protein Desor_4216 [Desulfosporosinus orientis DSM 765]
MGDLTSFIENTLEIRNKVDSLLKSKQTALLLQICNGQ